MVADERVVSSYDFVLVKKAKSGCISLDFELDEYNLKNALDFILPIKIEKEYAIICDFGLSTQTVIPVTENELLDIMGLKGIRSKANSKYKDFYYHDCLCNRRKDKFVLSKTDEGYRLKSIA